MLRQLLIIIAIIIASGLPRQVNAFASPAGTPIAAESVDATHSESLTWADLGMTDIIIFGESAAPSPTVQRTPSSGNDNGTMQYRQQSIGGNVLCGSRPPVQTTDYALRYFCQLRL